jgi:putative toxin-antitoxin system antitoxin component (TIGR02293 family)
MQKYDDESRKVYRGQTPIWHLRETAASAYKAPSLSEQIVALKAGLPIEFFDGLCAELEITAQEMASVLNIAPRTLARRKKEGRLQTAESERLYRLGALFEKAVAVLGDVEAARSWFKNPARALGDAAPLHFADTEPGAREVEDLLGRLEHGVFS